MFTRGTPASLFSGPLMLACNTNGNTQFYAMTKGEDAVGYKATGPTLPEVGTVAWSRSTFALAVDSTVYLYASDPVTLLCSHTFPSSDFKATFLGKTLFVTCGERMYGMSSLGSGECDVVLVKDLGYEGGEVVGLKGRELTVWNPLLEATDVVDLDWDGHWRLRSLMLRAEGFEEKANDVEQQEGKR